MPKKRPMSRNSKQAVVRRYRGRGPNLDVRFHDARIRKMVRDRETRKTYQQRLSHIMHISKGGWPTGRDYHHSYNPLFAPALGHFFSKQDAGKKFSERGPLITTNRPIGIAEAFAQISANRNGKGTLRIFEEGAGTGFLGQLREELGKKGVRAEITALTLHHAGDLEKSGVADEVVRQAAEIYAPKKELDGIISLFGPLTYTIHLLRKDLLLKYAYSLRKGGIMMVGFHYQPRLGIIATNTITMGLSEKPKRERKLKPEEEMDGIERAFEKRGFRARFYKTPEEVLKSSGRHLPNHILIVQRLHSPPKRKPR